jgi:hypothetical protein
MALLIEVLPSRADKPPTTPSRPADHGGLDHLAGGQLHDQRNDSRMREEHPLDRIAGPEQNHFLRQLYCPRMSQEPVQLGRRERGQHLVGPMRG